MLNNLNAASSNYSSEYQALLAVSVATLMISSLLFSPTCTRYVKRRRVVSGRDCSDTPRMIYDPRLSYYNNSQGTNSVAKGNRAQGGFLKQTPPKREHLTVCLHSVP